MIRLLKSSILCGMFSALIWCLTTMAAPAKQPYTDDGGNLQKILNLPDEDENTALSERLKEEDKAQSNPYSLILYKPTYFLPMYYTETPDQQVYNHNTPYGQTIDYAEFKGQLSFQVPIVYQAFGPDNTLNFGYTQLSYWQVYARSQFFRETDYEPEIFFSHLQTNYFNWRVGIEHQSNGRGGDEERSWNRTYAALNFSGQRWLFTAQPWTLIFKDVSSDEHNADIEHYMGHGELSFAYRINDNIIMSFTTRNNLESRFSRGAEELDFYFPLTTHFHGFIQFFSGYGQSLIEYNHYTNAAGIGLALNTPI